MTVINYVLSPVSTTRFDGPLTRAVKSGSGNRAFCTDNYSRFTVCQRQPGVNETPHFVGRKSCVLVLSAAFCRNGREASLEADFLSGNRASVTAALCFITGEFA